MDTRGSLRSAFSWTLAARLPAAIGGVAVVTAEDRCFMSSLRNGSTESVVESLPARPCWPPSLRTPPELSLRISATTSAAGGSCQSRGAVAGNAVVFPEAHRRVLEFSTQAGVDRQSELTERLCGSPSVCVLHRRWSCSAASGVSRAWQACFPAEPSRWSAHSGNQVIFAALKEVYTALECILQPYGINRTCGTMRLRAGTPFPV